MSSLSISPTSRLLVVDDDPAMTRLLSTLLARRLAAEIAVEVVSESSEARERIESGCIDILITDLEMPETNGLDLLRLAKEKNPCTQVIFLTGHSRQQALLDALVLGAADYLLKPIDHGALIDLVNQAHQRGQRWRVALAETWRRNRESRSEPGTPLPPPAAPGASSASPIPPTSTFPLS